MITTGIMIGIRSGDAITHDVAAFGYKREAVAALEELRKRGRNVDACIEAHPARLGLFRVWVLARPDDQAEFTWIMRPDGTWSQGRLTDGWEDRPAAWTPVPTRTGEPIPATVAHVTRTVPDTANRRERYRTKSNGSCGRYVRSDESVALCSCGWKKWTATRDEARAAARRHRNNPTP